jgi:hypothetical protein
MEWQKPSPNEVWQAIDVYLRVAYDGKSPSTTVKTRLDAIRTDDANSFYESTTLERDAAESPPQKFALRLGNHFYPHMKLLIEPTPDSQGHMYRADTHDKHIRPSPQSKEYKMFVELMENNQKLAEQIEAEWEKAGLPTFKQYLRNDLARRASNPSHVV